jgi:hypothetical protein
VRYAEGGFPGVDCGPTERLACALTETCSVGHTCVASPRLWVLAEESDAGVATVFASRSERDDRFISRPAFVEPTPTVPLPQPPAGSFWLAALAPDGGVVAFEPSRSEPMACLFYDCEQRAPGTVLQLRTGPLPVFANLRDTATGAPFSRVGLAPLRPATGQYRVRVVTVFGGSAPAVLAGSKIAAAGCDSAYDDLRAYWPQQAQQWTASQMSLGLDFVDEGALRIPVLDGGSLNSEDTVALEPFIRHWFQPGDRDLLMVILVTDRPAIQPGRATVTGFAYVDLNAQNESDALWVARHELGHLFGASDLYDAATGDCAFATSAEISGPNLYCGSSVLEGGSGGLVRLTAREVGWLEPDGGPASAAPACITWPGSQFPCDEN